MRHALLRLAIIGGLTLAALTATAARATSVTLDFDGLDTSRSGGLQILNFYAGGQSGPGIFGEVSGPGPDYGITFSPLMFADCETGAGCGVFGKAIFGATSGPNFASLSGGEDPTFMDVAGGFDTAISLTYGAPSAAGGTIRIWSGLGRTGDLLATVNLASTGDDFGDPTCPFARVFVCHFVAASASFNGVGHSLEFEGFRFVSDDLTLNLTDGAGVPEPASWALMIAGFGLIGAAVRRRRALAGAAMAGLRG